jgi:hypothetical protein
MKKLSALALGMLLIFLQASAQDHSIPLNEPDYNKPKLFADLPQRMTLKTAGIEALFNAALGTSISYRVADNFNWEGTVVSRSDAADATVKSVVIRSTNRLGATFTFTRTQKTDGSFTYIGRIMSRNNGDAFEIVLENGQYMLAKKNLYDLLSE